MQGSRNFQKGRCAPEFQRREGTRGLERCPRCCIVKRETDTKAKVSGVGDRV